MRIPGRLRLTILISAVVVLSGLVYVLNFPSGRPSVSRETGEVAGVVAGALSPLKLSSSAFPDQGKIPLRYTCDGENVSPPLEIANVPEAAAGLALLVEDIDAPSGSFWHYFLGNLDPRLEIIGEKTVPDGAFLGENDFGQTAYGGPCPPSGTHRYLFRLYALDRKLPLLSENTKGRLQVLMNGHILAQTILTGLYSR